MRTILCYLLVISLAACQKEIQLPEDPKTGRPAATIPSSDPEPTPSQDIEPPVCPVPEPPTPTDTLYRQEPEQIVIMSQFAPMLWGNSQYQLAEYYSAKKDLWNELAEWLKDDVFTFHETGKVWVSAGDTQHPAQFFESIQRSTQLYAQNGVIKLDLLDENYEPKTYSVAAYKSEESFTLSYTVNDSSKVFYTFKYIGKQ